MGCGGGYGGADYESAGTRWEVGGQYSFASREDAASFRDYVAEELSGQPYSPHGSETTKGHIQSDVLADAVAGYK